MEETKVLTTDDHGIFRQGLVSMINAICDIDGAIGTTRTGTFSACKWIT